MSDAKKAGHELVAAIRAATPPQKVPVADAAAVEAGFDRLIAVIEKANEPINMQAHDGPTEFETLQDALRLALAPLLTIDAISLELTELRRLMMHQIKQQADATAAIREQTNAIIAFAEVMASPRQIVSDQHGNPVGSQILRDRTN